MKKQILELLRGGYGKFVSGWQKCEKWWRLCGEESTDNERAHFENYFVFHLVKQK
jgi:hypothetical protein